MGKVYKNRNLAVIAIDTKQRKKGQNKTKQNKTKQNKTKQNKTKQNKTKQNKTKQTNTIIVQSYGKMSKADADPKTDAAIISINYYREHRKNSEGDYILFHCSIYPVFLYVL